MNAASPAGDRRLRYELLATDGAARRGRVTTHRGSFETPVFMPVGTRGTVIHLTARDYVDLELEVVLANTYHLMARPGPDVVAEMGGVGRFCGWDGHTLTDSGGFQVMSLAKHNQIDDDGVTFRSTYDGALMRLTPEEAVRVQNLLGADIQMALDECPALPAHAARVREAMERTHRWAERARAAHDHPTQALFGIVQGGADPALREKSAAHVAALGFDGYGIGGFSVGESRAEMAPALTAATASLPADRPRYLMGVGDPVRIVDAIGAGVDMFDCVLPTRLARHGTALTDAGRINLRNQRFARDPAPLAANSPFGNDVSRAFLRHLFKVNEPTAARIVTLHNVWFLVDLVRRSRAAIAGATFGEFAREVRQVWGDDSLP